MNKYLFLLVFDAVDIFQSNIGTVTWKEKFFLQDQTNTMDHEQVFILVSF